MGKRRASKHSAVAERSTGGRLRRLLLAVLVGALAFVGSGALLESATVMTRVLIAVGSVLVVFTMVALAKVRRGGKSAGRRRAVAAATAVEAPVEVSGELVSDEEIQPTEDADSEADSEVVLDDESVTSLDVLLQEELALALEADLPQADLLQELPEELSVDEDTDVVEVDEPAEDTVEDDEPAQDVVEDDEPALDMVEDAPAEDVVEDEPVENADEDLVPTAALEAARAEAEQQSLQRFRATVRGLGVRTGEDPVAVDVLARVVAAVDRLMAPDEFARPALSETGPLLAEAMPAAPAPMPAPMVAPAVAALAPVELAAVVPTAPQLTAPPMTAPQPTFSMSASVLEELARAEDSQPAPQAYQADQAQPTAQLPALAETKPVDLGGLGEDDEVVLPVPAPARPTHAPRGRRLRRHTFA